MFRLPHLLSATLRTTAGKQERATWPYFICLAYEQYLGVIHWEISLMVSLDTIWILKCKLGHGSQHCSGGRKARCDLLKVSHSALCYNYNIVSHNDKIRGHNSVLVYLPSGVLEINQTPWLSLTSSLVGIAGWFLNDSG